MNVHIPLLATAGVVLVFGLVIALLIMPNCRVHAGDGAGMKIAAFAIGLVLLIALFFLRNR